MPLLRKLLVLLFLLPCMAQASGDASEPSNREEFEQFWEKYTEAVKDVEAVGAQAAGQKMLPLVDFPFVTRGEMDFDPERSYTPETFTRILPQLLESDVGATELPTPMREYLMQKHIFSDQDILGGDIRVGNFLFHKKAGTWKWYYAYFGQPSNP